MRGCVLVTILGVLAACSPGPGSNSGFGAGDGGDVGGDQSDTEHADASGPTGDSAPGDEGASTSGNDSSTSAGESNDANGSLTSGPAESTTGGPGETDPATSSGSRGESSSDGEGSGSSGDDTTGASDTAADGMDACGFPLDGPWLEIEYWQAGVPATSPGWDFSMTAGWGEAQWATQGESWPEVWDIYQNIDVGNDPIGVVATVGGSGRWQLMLGFQDLVAYDYASVCVEGRSVSATASVQYDVYNPLNDCGGSSTMAHDWNMHAEGVDLGQCFVPGGGVQAVRIDTTGGSGALGIKRVRVILHGATY